MGRKCLAENKLLLYTNAGEPLATITWNESCLVGMGWVLSLIHISEPTRPY